MRVYLKFKCVMIYVLKKDFINVNLWHENGFEVYGYVTYITNAIQLNVNGFVCSIFWFAFGKLKMKLINLS